MTPLLEMREYTTLHHFSMITRAQPINMRGFSKVQNASQGCYLIEFFEKRKSFLSDAWVTLVIGRLPPTARCSHPEPFFFAVSCIGCFRAFRQ
jgi:hypothetical protein